MAYRASPGHQAVKTAAAKLLCPGGATDFRGGAGQTTTAVGTLHPRAMANEDAASQALQEGTSAETVSDHTTSGCASFGFRGGRMNKNLPCESCIPPPSYPQIPLQSGQRLDAAQREQCWFRIPLEE